MREIARRATVLVSVIDPDDLRRDARRSSSTRRRSSRRTGFARSRSATRATRTPSKASRARGSTTSRPSRPRACSAATRTGAGRSGCRSTTSRSASSPSTSASSATIQARVPDRLGQRADLRRDRAGPGRPARLDLAAGPRRPPAALRRDREAPDGSGLEGQPHLQRVLPRRQRRGARREHQTGWTALVADLILDPPGSGPTGADELGGFGGMSLSRYFAKPS